MPRMFATIFKLQRFCNHARLSSISVSASTALVEVGHLSRRHVSMRQRCTNRRQPNGCGKEGDRPGYLEANLFATMGLRTSLIAGFLIRVAIASPHLCRQLASPAPPPLFTKFSGRSNSQAVSPDWRCAQLSVTFFALAANFVGRRENATLPKCT